MKKIQLILAIVFAFYFTVNLQAQTITPTVSLTSLGIGVASIEMNPSAQLEVKSDTKGFLPPRMTATERDAIASPVAGLMLYCSNCGANGELEVYNGSSWTNLGGSAATAAVGSDTTTSIVSDPTNFNIMSATIVAVDKLDITPSADFSLNTGIISNIAATNSITNAAISRYYKFGATTNAFSGVLKINYDEADLNGIAESDLKLLYHNGTGWTSDLNSSNYATDNFVQSSSLSSVALNEVTAGIDCVPSVHTTTVYSACSQEYDWNGQTYTESGLYTGSTTNCVTEQLNLTINNNYNFGSLVLFIVTPADTILVLGFEGHYLINDVKEIIQNILDIPVSDQILTFAGRELDNLLSLANYNIQRQSTMYLTISTLTPSTISVTGDSSFIYNGTAQGPETSLVTGSTGTVTYLYKGIGSTDYLRQSNKPTEVGTYEVIAYVAPDAEYKSANSEPFSFVIMACNNVGLASATYTASPICANATTTLTYSGLTGTNASVTWTQYADGTGATYGTGSPSSAVGPGTYYAYATGYCGSAVVQQVVVTGTQPAMPTLACYETASFNDSSCSWVVTGSQPAMPTLACYETASFNTTTCAWVVTGTAPMPVVTTITACGSYTWNSASYTASGNYTYAYSNGSCTVVDTLHLTITTRPTGVITGTATICNGGSSNLSIAVTGSGPWSGTLSSGQSFSGSVSPIVVSVTPSTNNTYTLASLSAGTCASIAGDLSGSATVTVNARPSGVISGGAAYCAGAASSTTLSIAVTGVGPWSGTLSNGQSFSGSSSPISVSVAAPNATTVYTIASLNDSRCAALSGDRTGTATVALNARPTGVISGAPALCSGESANITLTFIGVAPFSGSYTNGTSTYLFNSSTSSLAIPVTPSTTTTYTLVSVRDANVCNSLAGDVSGSAVVTVNPAMPDPIIGVGNVCPYIGRDTVLSYTVPAVTEATNYNWLLLSASYIQVVTSSGTPISYNTSTGYNTPSNTIYVKFLAGFASSTQKQIRVKATTRCGTSPLRVFYLGAVSPITPGVITPYTTNICPSIGTGIPVVYIISKVIATQTYVWSINGAAIITHTNGQGVNDTAVSITFDANYATSTLSVYTVNDCGVSSSRSFTIVRTAASTPGLISGPTNVCQNIGSSAQVATYSVSVVSNVVSYNWTLPSGVTNVTGQGTNMISFRYPAGFVSGSVSVVAVNGCGTSGSRTLNVSRALPMYPGQIDVVSVSDCPNRVFRYSIAAMPANATLMQWVVPAEGTLLTGQGTTSITVSYPSTIVNGMVSVQGVSNCGTSTTRQSTIKLSPCSELIATTTTKGTKEINEEKTLQVIVSPNPTTSSFNLQVIGGVSEATTARVLDIQGRMIKEVRVVPNQTINLGSELKAGSYMLEVRQGDKVKTVRVVKY